MRAAVIGAGWYGAHLSRHLLRQGHDVTIFDRRGIFAAASGHNQDRVHLGFHYPRSAKTRTEIALCHNRFCEEYPTVEVFENVYAVAKQSCIDFRTYTAICCSHGLEVNPQYTSSFGLSDAIEGCILTNERVVDTQAVKAMFEKELTPYLVKWEVEAEGMSGYDVVLNCTNLRIPDPEMPVYYEAAMILEVDGPKKHPSLTVMDGPFPTLLATPVPGRYTLSQVQHTAIAKVGTYAGAQSVIDCTKWEDRAHLFMDAMEEFIPGFKSKFTPTGARMAVRTKPVNNTDSRECLTRADGRIMHISCGKFMSVYIASARVDAWLESING